MTCCIGPLLVFSLVRVSFYLFLDPTKREAYGSNQPIKNNHCFSFDLSIGEGVSLLNILRESGKKTITVFALSEDRRVRANCSLPFSGEEVDKQESIGNILYLN